jgi:WD40 repeat protein
MAKYTHLITALLVCFCLATTHAGKLDHHVGPVTDIAVSGDRVFSVSQSGVCQGMGSQLIQLVDSGFRVTSIAVIGNWLMMGGGDPGLSGNIGIYDLNSREMRSIQVADDLVYDLAIHPEEPLAAFACADNRVMTIRFPDMELGTLQERHRHTAAARAVAFSSDGKHLASGGLDALVMLSLVGESKKPIQMQDHSDKVECLTFSPDSLSLASGARDGKVRIHNMEGRLIRTYSKLSGDSKYIAWGEDHHILSITWGGAEPMLVAGASKGTLHLLSNSDNRSATLPRRMKKPVYRLAFDQDGELLIGSHSLSSYPLASPDTFFR